MDFYSHLHLWIRLIPTLQLFQFYKHSWSVQNHSDKDSGSSCSAAHPHWIFRCVSERRRSSLIWPSSDVSFVLVFIRNESPDRHRAAHRNIQVPPLSARAHPVRHHSLQQWPGQPVWVSRLLRLCPAPHPAVSVWTPGMYGRGWRRTSRSSH